MIRFRNKKGFSTFEVLITLALVGFFIVPLITMQVSVRNRTVRSSHALQRLFFMIYLLHHARHEQDKLTDTKQGLPFSLAATESDPATQLTYVREMIPEQSVLTGIPGLSREIVRASPINSVHGTHKVMQTLVTFIYRQPEESEESASSGKNTGKSENTNA